MTRLKANSASLVERIPFIYEKVDKEATASPSNPAKPLGIIIAGELLEQSLYKTLQKIKELEM